MARRNIVISSIIVILLVGAVYLLLDRHATDSSINFSYSVGTKEAAGDNSDAAATDKAKVTDEGGEGTASGGREDTAGDEIQIVKSVELEVRNNSPEYDLKVYLCRDSKGAEFLRFEYYYNGVGTVNELGADKIPELVDAFGEKAGEPDKNIYKVKNVYLNSRYSKVYFAIRGEGSGDYAETAVYGVNLGDFSHKKLFSEAGKFSDLLFSKNFKYVGFSFFRNTDSGTYQEKSLLQVARCEDDLLLVKGSRTQNGDLIGQPRDADFIRDYEILSWQSENTARLKETSRPKNGGAHGDNKETAVEILYDVEKNVLLNIDGSLLEDPRDTGGKDGSEGNQGGSNGGKSDSAGGKSDNTGGKGGNASGGSDTLSTGTESDAVKTLKAFYSYLSSESDYGKALDLLSDDFTLELGILKQLGVDVLTKKDIDLESASIYAGMLKIAKIDRIVREEASGDTVTIYYYQLFSMGNGAEVKVPIEVRLVKSGGGWKISKAREVDDDNWR